MAYSDFTTISQVEKQFGINQTLGRLFPSKQVKTVRPSAHLKADLLDVQQMPLINSEKAKSEFLIVPVLKEVWRRNRRFSIFSGYTFDVDKEQQLSGICDYLFSTDTDSLEIKSAVFCVVEAKNRTTQEGIPQAAAELVAAQKFNKQEGNEMPIIFGAVTTGLEWLFISLRDNILTVDTERYYLNDDGIPHLLGVLENITSQIQ